jgi:bacterioferritin
MKGDPGILNYLNKVLTNELTAINQYFLHARMLRNWGFKELEEVEYKESVGEMKDADELINRILFLDGLPNLQDLHRLRVGENVPELLKADLELELAARGDLLEGIAACERVRDFASRELLTDILEHEEEHIDWIETQLGLIEKVGLENYLQRQIEAGEEGA